MRVKYRSFVVEMAPSELMRILGWERAAPMSDEDDELPEGHDWFQGPVECEICGFEWVAVAPKPIGLSEPTFGLECKKCGAMCGRPV